MYQTKELSAAGIEPTTSHSYFGYTSHCANTVQLDANSYKEIFKRELERKQILNLNLFQPV